MKKFLKIVPCLLVSACVFVSACACSGGNGESRSRKVNVPEIQQAEPLDPNFSVEPETEQPDEKPGEHADKRPEEPECPDCPKPDDKHDRAPKHKWHHHCKHKQCRPAPFHRPPRKAD